MRSKTNSFPSGIFANIASKRLRPNLAHELHSIFSLFKVRRCHAPQVGECSGVLGLPGSWSFLHSFSSCSSFLSSFPSTSADGGGFGFAWQDNQSQKQVAHKELNNLSENWRNTCSLENKIQSWLFWAVLWFVLLCLWFLGLFLLVFSQLHDQKLPTLGNIMFAPNSLPGVRERERKREREREETSTTFWSISGFALPSVSSKSCLVFVLCFYSHVPLMPYHSPTKWQASFQGYVLFEYCICWQAVGFLKPPTV